MPLRSYKSHEIDPDEVLMDAHSRSYFDRDQFEGRIERPISTSVLYSVLIFFVVVAGLYVFQVGNLQLFHGAEYRTRSQANILRPVPIFAARGIIYDRNGIALAWNAPASVGATTSLDIQNIVTERDYATSSGFAHVLGYVQYPSKDKNGFYYQEDFNGVAGIEKYYDSILQGTNGSKLVEVDARGGIVSENVARPPEAGNSIHLSIDSRVQSALFNSIKDVATRVGFNGGAGIIMDVHTGEVLAMTSYPEYSSKVMSDKEDTVAIKSYFANVNQPFLDRVIKGLYAPGSIVKPYVAMGVLAERIIDPRKIIHDSGSISITNPYNPEHISIFRDWKALGDIDMRHGIAMSSDVYFYTVGGGYKDQAGLGITRLDKYFQLFGFGSTTALSFFTGPVGLIPTPEWKKKTFDEDWYLGDTYHTAIGQYGFQVTPVQVIRAVAALANYGTILTPTPLKGDIVHVERTIDLARTDYDLVHEGMRLSATEGVAHALGVPYVDVAAKTGTAELGVSKANVNSWVTGFWPYEDPRYAFAVVMDHGSVNNLVGAAGVMRQQLDWMHVNTPEYLK
jgi:penicillin-binding protein 2